MLIGNLTADPEIKYTPKGTAIAAFGIAVNRNYTTETGEKREEVTFIGIEAYGRVAEIIGEYCKKGHPLYVEGRLKNDEWEDKETKQKRRKTKVVCENIQLLHSNRTVGGDRAAYADEQAGGKAAPRSAAAPPPQRSMPPRPPVDPDLDAAPDDIAF